MTVAAVVGALVTLAMAGVAWLGWQRWPGLDPGGRWLVVAVAVSFALSLVMLALVVVRRPTRPAHEIQLLLSTAATLLGFAAWQRRPAARRVLHGLAAGFAVLWLAVLIGGGWDSPFSLISAPVGHTLKTAAAGFTLIVLVRSTFEPLTSQVWFWFGAAVMLIYGTEVILDPFWQRAFGVRDDLLMASYLFTQLVGLAGYGLMVRGLLVAPTRVR